MVKLQLRVVGAICIGSEKENSQKMTGDYIVTVQQRLGLSDTKLAAALGVTRQTVGNWKKGRPCPALARNAIRWMLELRRLEPANDNLPRHVQVRL